MEKTLIKLASALLLLLMTLTACSDSDTPTSPTPPAQANCPFTISTTTFSLSGAGASATLSVNTGSGCSWTVQNNSQSFVTVSGNSSQTGSGTVSFTVSENLGDTRTGSLTIAGQNIVINQAAGDPLFGNWRGTIAKGFGMPRGAAGISRMDRHLPSHVAVDYRVGDLDPVAAGLQPGDSDHLQRQQHLARRADRHAVYLRRYADQRSTVALGDLLWWGMHGHVERIAAIMLRNA